MDLDNGTRAGTPLFTADEFPHRAYLSRMGDYIFRKYHFNVSCTRAVFLIGVMVIVAAFSVALYDYSGFMLKPFSYLVAESCIYCSDYTSRRGKPA